MLPFMLASADWPKKCLFYDDVIRLCVKLQRNPQWMSMSRWDKCGAESVCCYFSAIDWSSEAEWIREYKFTYKFTSMVCTVCRASMNWHPVVSTCILWNPSLFVFFVLEEIRKRMVILLLQCVIVWLVSPLGATLVPGRSWKGTEMWPKGTGTLLYKHHDIGWTQGCHLSCRIENCPLSGNWMLHPALNQ